MKISRAIVKNYRNLKGIDVTLGSIVTLIGENNSGKSNFLRALSIPLSSTIRGIQSVYLGTTLIGRQKKHIIHFCPKIRQSFLAGVYLQNSSFPFCLRSQLNCISSQTKMSITM